MSASPEINDMKPQGTTHQIGNTFFKATKSFGNRTWACKWIKSRQAWSKPQEYINFPA